MEVKEEKEIKNIELNNLKNIEEINSPDLDNQKYYQEIKSNFLYNYLFFIEIMKKNKIYEKYIDIASKMFNNIKASFER